MAVKTTMLDYAFFEGEIVPFGDAKISIGTHAIQYGTGAFAGVRGYLDHDGETINIFRLIDHTTRLLNSGKLLRAQLPYTPESLAEVIASLVARNAPTSDVYIRPFIYKSSVQLTPRLRGLDDQVAVYMMAMGDYLDLNHGQKAAISSWVRVPDNAIPSRGKLTGSYVNSAFIKDEIDEKGADEAIVLNTAGKVAEGSSCNLFMVRNGVLTTPPLTADILEGITRRTILQFAQEAGIPTEQREIDRHRALPGRGGLLLRHRRPGRLDRVHRRSPGRRRHGGADHEAGPRNLLRRRPRQAAGAQGLALPGEEARPRRRLSRVDHASPKHSAGLPP